MYKIEEYDIVNVLKSFGVPERHLPRQGCIKKNNQTHLYSRRVVKKLNEITKFEQLMLGYTPFQLSLKNGPNK